MNLNFTRVALTFNVTVPEKVLEKHIAASPQVVGAELARQVIAYETAHKLGYYPALDYFQQQGGIERELLDALDNIAWVVTSMVRNEIRIRMRPVFSKLQFENLQIQAYAMPAVRPGNPNALALLAQHYSATSVKVSLIATLIQKLADPEAAARMAEGMIYRWLKEHFSHIEVTSSHTL